MRHLDVLFSPAQVEGRELRGKLIFPVDVLRFTTTAVRAIASGARTLYPFASLASLRAFASKRPRSSYLTAGEENGLQLPALDLGNSPADFTPDACRGKDVLCFTTNGSRLLKALEGFGQILPLAPLNLSAVADFASRVDGSGVVACAGWRNRFAAEDAAVAGLFVVEALRRNPELELSEAALAARDLYVRNPGTWQDAVKRSKAARRLETQGFADDIPSCLRLDEIPLLLQASGSPLGIRLHDDAPPAFPLDAPAKTRHAGHPQTEAPPPERETTPSAGKNGDAPENEGTPGRGNNGEGKENTGGPSGNGGSGGNGTTKDPGAGPPEDDAREKVDGFRMSLGDHLIELRKRVIYSILFVVLGFLGVFCFYDSFMNVVLRPVERAFDAIEKDWKALQEDRDEEGEPRATVRPKIIQDKPQERFVATIKISFFLGLFLASPLIFWQLWLFVSAGLYPWERKWVAVFAPATFVCFTAGVLFLYFVVLPIGLRFLLGFGYHPDVLPTVGYGSYVSFFLLLSVLMGLVFELPLVMLFLARLGLVTPDTFRKKRKHFIIVIFVGAALVTPPDVITQVLMAIPLLILYELGIFLSRLAYKKRLEARS